jgi:hypothetical protein
MDSKTVVTAETPLLIQPKDIDPSRHFSEAFGSMESEKQANLIVRYCQLREGWVPFTLQQLQDYAKTELPFALLLGQDQWVPLGEDGQYHVTVGFIARCFAASPVIRERPKGRRVVVLNGKVSERKAFLGTIVGEDTVYFTLVGGGEITVTQEDPRVRPPDEWVSQQGGDKIHEDRRPRIMLDDGGIHWGIHNNWYVLSPQPQ